jgi:hypothetical protein
MKGLPIDEADRLAAITGDELVPVSNGDGQPHAVAVSTVRDSIEDHVLRTVTDEVVGTEADSADALTIQGGRRYSERLTSWVEHEKKFILK